MSAAPRAVVGGIALRLAAWLVALGVVALPLVGVVNGWFGGDRWPLKSLEIEAGFERISAEQIRGAVARHAGAGFFAIKLDAVRASLEKLPGVDGIEVRKRWPDTLIVRVGERRALAAWPGRRLLGADGTLFGPFEADFSAGLPALAGPDDRAAEVLAFYGDASRALQSAGLGIATLELSERGSWTVGLGSGAAVVVGRDDPAARLGRFLAAWPQLARPAGAELRRADLRYANGFAVEWAQRPAPDAAAPAPPAAPEAQPELPAAPADESPRTEALEPHDHA